MDISFLCDFCSDYILADDDYITCDCGKKWCSTRCAKYHGYVNRKTSSYCNFCLRDDDDNGLYLFNLRHFIIDLVKDETNNS